MTTAQLDHLRRIDAHLANLLSTAEKRTPGEWTSREKFKHSFELLEPRVWLGASSSLPTGQQEHNAAFIASCAGNAEAGWKATRAAIAEILASHTARYESWCLVCREPNQEPGLLEDYPLPPWADDILAAFPNV